LRSESRRSGVEVTDASGVATGARDVLLASCAVWLDARAC
jgi:hypothetical protein